ncbi:twin-arginine translocase subunit TatC [Nesterenkonia lacusekhoensis]
MATARHDEPAKKSRRRKRRDPEGTMSLAEHLRELRNRVFIAAVGVLLGAVAGFFIYDTLFRLLAAPVLEFGGTDRSAEIAFNTVGQPLDLMIRISLFVGIVVSSPLWLYQIWAFIMPGLKKSEKRYAVGFIAASVPLFLAGIVLAYTVLPRAIGFFFALNPEGTSNFIAPDVYFSFVLHIFLAFGIAMVLPVVLVGINMMGLVSGKQVLKAWRWVVMLIAIVSAIAAPEVVSMIFIGLPLCLLFGVAIVLCLLNDRRRVKRQAEREEQNEELVHSTELQ